MGDIYLSRGEKKKIETTMRRGEEAGKIVEKFLESVAAERNQNLSIIKEVKLKKN